MCGAIGKRGCSGECETAAVRFKPLSDDDIERYLQSGESFDKAGAYAAQGEGAQLIASIEGDRETVIGLPVRRLLEEFPEIWVNSSAKNSLIKQRKMV